MFVCSNVGLSILTLHRTHNFTILPFSSSWFSSPSSSSSAASSHLPSASLSSSRETNPIPSGPMPDWPPHIVSYAVHQHCPHIPSWKKQVGQNARSFACQRSHSIISVRSHRPVPVMRYMPASLLIDDFPPMLEYDGRNLEAKFYNPHTCRRASPMYVCTNIFAL